MSYKENQTIVSLISNLIGLAVYSYFVVQKAGEGAFNSAAISNDWGWYVLIVIGLVIVCTVVLTVLITVLQAVTERDEDPQLSDERDRLFDLKSNLVAFAAFGAGFTGAMFMLAIGRSPVLVLNLIVYSLFGAGIIGYIAQLYFYRRGY